MKLVSTCSLTNNNDMSDYLIEAWAKACPNNNKFVKGDLNNGSLWFFEYVEALVQLTDSMEWIFHYRSDYMVKVLHIISSIIESSNNTELKLTLTDILWNLALCDVQDNNKSVVDSFLTKICEYLFHDDENIVKIKFMNMLCKCYRNTNVSTIINKVISHNKSLREIWNHFLKYGYLDTDHEMGFKEYLTKIKDTKYCHKCIETYAITLRGLDNVKQLSVTSSNNFEFADIDTLFDADSDSEPVSKKAKINTDETENIITRLESDTLLLCNIKENIFTTENKNRIKNVCDKLKNIIA